jgi:hypothetical protein
VGISVEIYVLDLVPDNRAAMPGDILHFAQAFFLEFRVSDGQNLVHNQNLVLALPIHKARWACLRQPISPLPHGSVPAPNTPPPQTRAAHTFSSYTG